MVIAGSYFSKTSAQGSPAPECTCQYPNGGGYGTLQPIDPPVDGSKFTCKVKTCYLKIQGEEQFATEESDY